MAEPAIYLGRRLESVDAARDLVVLLVLELVNAFDALEAVLGDVLTEFFAITYTSFLVCRRGSGGGVVGGLLPCTNFISQCAKSQYVVLDKFLIYNILCPDETRWEGM